jgi:hypothetical protein
MALERFQAAQKALGKLFDIVLSVILEAVPLKVCAARLGINPSHAAGRFYAAMQVLQDHYESITPRAEPLIRHTIGSQTGPAGRKPPRAPGG